MCRPVNPQSSPSTTTPLCRARSPATFVATTASGIASCAPNPGGDALDTLKELKLRGDTVAVFVADYRMPQMSGIEFLEKAMDFFPLARRVLLTAYADTHAAIDAINVVDLDHYLLKPWDPPEEKLYPVIDGLLEEWRAVGRPRHAVHQGHRPPVQRAVMGGAAVPGPQRVLVPRRQRRRAQGAATSRSRRPRRQPAPVVITEKGETLVEPTDVELATLLGLSTSPQLEMYDLAVIGGGPAGLAAAVYGASEGLKTVLIEKATTGGQAGRSSKIENYLGFPTGVSGAELTTSARRQAERFGAEVITTQEAGKLEVNGVGAAHSIRLNEDNTIGARAVILATGVDYRQLQITGCWDDPDDPDDATTSAAACSTAPRCRTTASARGEDVYIVGRRQLGRPGRDVHVADGQVGDHADPRAVAGGGDVAVPRRPDPQDPEHHGPYLHRGRRTRWRGRTPVRAGAARQADRKRPRQ